MEFEINRHTWTIEEVGADDLNNIYSHVMREPVIYVFGLTQYSAQKIYINNEVHPEQKVRTLKHELTHCYAWEHGLYNVPNYNDEMVCDLVACSNDWVNEIVAKYFKGQEKDGVRRRNFRDIKHFKRNEQKTN